MLDRRTRVVLFYATMAAVLVVLVTKLQQHFLPTGVATQIGHNSEAFLFAILVAAEIQILRNRERTPRLLAGMAGVGAVLIGLGLVLRDADLPPTVTTLNEPVIGSGFLLLYLCLPRSRTTAVLTTLTVALGIMLLFDTSFVLNQAESLIPLVLAGPAIDIFDPRLLSRELPGTRVLQLSWMVGLIIVAVALIPVAAWARAELHGGVQTTIDYLQRAAEGYWGWFLVHAYFAFWLGSYWRKQETDRQSGGSGRAAQPA